VCARLRFGLLGRRERIVGRVIVTSSIALVAAIGNAQSMRKGCCPQSTDGWLLFQDSNHRVPDFWRRDSVVVDIVDVCPHGINFYFVSEEDEQPRYVALVIVKPSRELYETRAIHRIGDPPIDVRLERARVKYADLVSTLERLFGVRFSPEGRIDFTNRPVDGRPVISPCRGLTLRWRGNVIELRGYLDVYMTMFS
jgi:hypothetical protein